jgi:hypothetical protein
MQSIEPAYPMPGGLAQAIPNAWLASAKGHPFWLYCVQQVIKRAGACAATNTERCARADAQPSLWWSICPPPW